MKVAIVTPSGDMVHTDFAMCLVRLVAASMGAGIQPMIINPKSSLVQKGRWSGVTEALAHGADKILFIDSDQTFPANALIRLLSHNKKFVSATCRLRQDKIEYAARGYNGERINMSHYTGLRKVASNGFAFSLIDAELFNKIDEPWFNVSFDDGQWISEDESFCHAAAEHDCDVWVDADLTKEIGHIGVKTYI
jgi:hypothetical protein